MTARRRSERPALRCLAGIASVVFASFASFASSACAGSETAADEPAEAEIRSNGSPRPPKAACTPAKRYVATSWPEADALFHRDPQWLGADAAYSVELSRGRILWLFGDSFVATATKPSRLGSKMVRNSIAIQTGTDPTTGTIAFSWKKGLTPSSFFPEEGGHWFWPLHGARVGTELVLFLNELVAVKEGLGFESVATRMVRIANPDAEPDAWTWTSRTLPKDERTHGVSVVVAEGHLHALTTKKSFFFDVELERWPLDALDRDSTFWDGSRFAPPKASEPIWNVGAPEFVTAAHCGEWLTAESTGFGATDIAIRRAPALAGPWTDPVKVFHPPESDRDKPFVYAGKLHPALTGADLVVTYAANSFDFAEVLRDTTLYYPRFVRIEERR